MFTGLFIDAFIVTPYVEQTKSELVWNIANGAGANASPNVLSELSFKDVKSIGYGLKLAHLNAISENFAFYIEGEYADSSIRSGTVQDSDYSQDNRAGEFSRSISEVEDDSLSGWSLAAGVKTRWFGARGHYLTTLIGHQRQNVDYTMTDGVQVIPESLAGQPLTGLNSTYNSEFESWYIKVGTEHVFKWGTIGLSYEHHDLDFYAEADWNLRTDFAHPKSFVHEGEGTGKAITIAYTYPINLQWDVYLTYTKRENTVEDGYDQTFFANGNSAIIRLNEVEYEAEQFQLGFRYIF
ncbi:hypothetical protein R50073_48990 (plasmid) [Maricurvus nonylphenolicus]|jgi:hypothetical protein|uniref:hypothetical protein n=1 Tax=Maricurvus nonylphenolicus TaxID=1008307 RepID=UPI0036F1E88F